MKEYVICFIISAIFALLSKYCFRKNNNNLGKIFLILSFLGPCVLAGLRSIMVGTDVTVYVTGLYNSSIQSSNIFNFLGNIDIEYGFALLVYLSSKFGDIHFCLFFIELFVVFPICIYIYKCRNEKSIFLSLLIFLLVIYCSSLNLMRQSIAISFVILSTYYFKNEKYFKTFLLFLLSLSFHYTSAVAILIYIMIYIINKTQKNKLSYLLLITVAICLIPFILDNILALLPKYSRYLTRENTLSMSDILMSSIKKIFWIVLLLITYRSKTNTKNEKKELLLSIMLLISDYSLFLCNIKFSSAGRLGYYFLYYAYFIFIPLISNAFIQKKLVNIFLVIILSLFWINMAATDGQSSVYPYKSDYFVSSRMEVSM